MKRTNEFEDELILLTESPETILNPFDGVKQAMAAPHPSKEFIKLFNERVAKGWKKAKRLGHRGDHLDYAAWNWALHGDAHDEDEDTVSELEIHAWSDYYDLVKEGPGQFLELLQTDYPEYSPVHEYLCKVLSVMGYQIGDPLIITVVNPSEPTTISITIEPKYLS